MALFPMVAVTMFATVACPWVTGEELDTVRGRITGYDFQPGTPETDAKRFYSNEEKTEFVEFNYDESKAGELGKDYTLEDPLGLERAWHQRYSDRYSRGGFAMVDPSVRRFTRPVAGRRRYYE